MLLKAHELCTSLQNSFTKEQVEIMQEICDIMDCQDFPVGKIEIETTFINYETKFFFGFNNEEENNDDWEE